MSALNLESYLTHVIMIINSIVFNNNFCARSDSATCYACGCVCVC